MPSSQVAPVEPPNGESETDAPATSAASDASFKAKAVEETKIDAGTSDVEQPPAKPKTMRTRLVAKLGLNPSHALFTDKRVQANSLAACRWACFVDACCQTVLAPNFPYMCIPDFHEDSFPNIKPFKFATAQYFIPMCPAIGAAIASLFFGPLSDKIGRKPCMLICLYLGAVGCVVKYFCRGTFWGFNAANFANGLVGASLVVGMAYVGDVFPEDKAKAADELGALMGLMMLGMSAGNVIAILMEEQGLFMPLWAAAGLSLSAGIVASIWMVEADRSLHQKAHEESNVSEQEGEDAGDKPSAAKAEEDLWKPTKINWRLFSMIMVGAVLDNLGSTGLTMAMSPLMLNEYQLDAYKDPDPDIIMNENEYKWIVTLVALAIIPAIPFSMVFYQKVGTAGGCVWGNVFTVFVTLGLLLITKNDASKTWFIIFVLVLYAGYPFTVLSQLTTGPMMDAIAPEEERGKVQGYCNGVIQATMAGGPVLLGSVADSEGTSTCIVLCMILSAVAAVANMPLMRHPQLMWVKDPNAKDHHEHEEDLGTDEELVRRAEAGEWIPAKELDRINTDRMNRGEMFLKLRYGKYENDKDYLGKLKKRAAADFTLFKEECSEWLTEMKEGGREGRAEIVKQVLHARPPPEFIKQSKKELGEWFTDYLEDNGWWLENDPTAMKMMIMNAFPRLVRDLNADNIEVSTLLILKVMNQHINLANAANSESVSSLLASTAVTRRASVSKKAD